jgi:hypothetical protein
MEDLIQRAAEDLIKARYRIALTGAGFQLNPESLIFVDQMEFGLKILRLK